MIHWLALLLLAPVFFLQGRYVRLVTPKLPEATGMRSGSTDKIAHQQTPVSLLVIGDSAAAGVGASHQNRALTGNILSSLGQHTPVQWKLLAESGDRSSQLIDKLENEPAGDYGFVVVSIGVNDVTALTSSAQWSANLETIHHILQSKFNAQHILFSSVPPMHLFPALPQPLRWWLGLRARELNRLMQNAIGELPGSHFIETPYETDPGQMASDGFHPGEPAYEAWGRQLAAVILENMR